MPKEDRELFSMSELVAGLEARGYVERQPDPSDRRARLVRLTPEGRRLRRLAMREIADIEAAWLQRMGRELDDDWRPALERALRVDRPPRLQPPSGGVEGSRPKS